MFAKAKSVAQDTDPRVEITTEYNPAAIAEALLRIVRGVTVAVWFKGALTPELCAEASKRIEAFADKAYYDASKVGRIGESLYETQLSPYAMVDYFRSAENNLRVSRSMFPKRMYPLDELRLGLDDYWPKTVSRLRLEHGLCGLGLIRFLDLGGAILPHNDVASVDMPNSFLAQGLDIQVAWNAYMLIPEDGGELLVYPKRLSHSEYDANRQATPNEYALRRECLPSNPVVIRPSATDVVMFDASFPHEVTECAGTRYSLSAFIGVRRSGELELFS